MIRKKIIPPASMNFVGIGDFELIGNEFKNYFIGLGNLRPDHHVLDVGCGLGRMAIPLTKYLNTNGQYWGFDPVSTGIEWCKEHISSSYSNFHFQHCDIFNRHYNQNGKIFAETFKFPFAENFFDFAILTSVFTHMLPNAMENYLSEVARVLKPGGKCLITFFLVDQESLKSIISQSAKISFQHTINQCFVTDPNDPEAAIAYPEQYVLNLFANNSLHIEQPIHYGNWSNRESSLTYQDIIIATKCAKK